MKNVISAQDFQKKIKKMPGFKNEFESAFTIINAVTLGIQEGVIYCSDDKNSKWIFILHQSGFGQLIFSDNNPDPLPGFLSFVKHSKTIPAYFHLYDFPTNITEGIFSGFNIRDRARIQFQGVRNPMYEPLITRNFTIRQVTIKDEQLLESCGLSAYKNFWPNYEAFISEGFGVIAVDSNNQAQSICYSAAIDRNFAEVDVLTSESSRKLGLGKQVVEYFIRVANDRNLKAAWDCFTDNAASKALAAQCGFYKPRKYRFLSLFDPEK